MKTPISLAGLVAGITLISSTPLSAATAPVEARLAQQNALFDEEYESDLKAHPETTS
jgi:hypothetical protein